MWNKNSQRWNKEKCTNYLLLTCLLNPVLFVLFVL